MGLHFLVHIVVLALLRVTFQQVSGFRGVFRGTVCVLLLASTSSLYVVRDSTHFLFVALRMCNNGAVSGNFRTGMIACLIIASLKLCYGMPAIVRTDS